MFYFIIFSRHISIGDANISYTLSLNVSMSLFVSVFSLFKILTNKV